LKESFTGWRNYYYHYYYFAFICVLSRAGWPNSVLEGHCPAEFSSSLPQHTACLMIFNS